jgi:predicted nucleic acid-binding Zn ribbon protein
MTLQFQQLWAAGRVRLADLPASSWAALSQPPLASLPAPIAAQRLERIRAVPFGDVFGVLAVLSHCRSEDTLAALELLGVIEDGEQQEALPDVTPAPLPALALDAIPAPPPPAAPPGPPAPAPLTLPEPPAPPAPAPRKAPAMRACSVCGEAFQVHGRQLFCSDACQAAARRERRRAAYQQQHQKEERSCVECGAPFTARRHNHFCCTAACQSRQHNRRRAEERAAARPIKECPQCGSAFQPKLRAAQVFCSAACVRAADFARRGRMPPEARPQVACVICGSLFHQGSKPNRNTCSAACRKAQVRRNDEARRLRLRQSPEVARLVAEFSSTGRWRWLLRQIHEQGIQDVARSAGLTTKEASQVCRLIYINKV